MLITFLILWCVVNQYLASKHNPDNDYMWCKFLFCGYTDFSSIEINDRYSIHFNRYNMRLVVLHLEYDTEVIALTFLNVAFVYKKK